METIIKKTREVGTSAGVLLPRNWLNKQVIVTIFYPSKEEIAKEVMDIIIKNGLNEETKGIYLFGSYARGEEDENSDIDILVITQNLNKLLNYGNYEIIFISERNFSKNLSSNINYLSILKEIKVIINKDLILKYTKKQKLNIKKILPEIERVVKINKETVKMLNESNKNIPDGIVYSIVLRLRELYLIKCLISNNKYYKKDIIKIIGEKVYSAYLRIKRNEREVDNIFTEGVINILNLSEKWLRELKELRKELKV